MQHKRLAEESGLPDQTPLPSKRASARQATRRKRAEPQADQELVDCDRWERCQCGVWISLGRERESMCTGCGRQVSKQDHQQLECWVQCDACGKWRAVSPEVVLELEACGTDAQWYCWHLFGGGTCRTSSSDWGAIVRKNARQQKQQEHRAGLVNQLSERRATPGAAGPQKLHWKPQNVPHSSLLPEYIPGRDTLLQAGELASGVDAYDADTSEHVLWTTTVPKATIEAVAPAALRLLHLHATGSLKENVDGRVSAGPIDLAAFLAQSHIQEAVKQAVHACSARSTQDASSQPDKGHALMRRIIHVSPDGRKVFIGEECEAMSFCKAWKSLPIQSWAGGVKLADMAGSKPNCALQGSLSVLLQKEEAGLIAAAEDLWLQLASHEATSEAAARMSQHASTIGSPCLGHTAWNAYSINLDFRTGAHVDAKNVAGSYSALVILETGEPFCGCFYLMPQYRVALDVRQGIVLFHRSGDKPEGLHGNSGLWRPMADSHRIAVIFYLTDLKRSSNASIATSDLDPHLQQEA